MKQITNISELTPGTPIVRLLGDTCEFWEYLCLHPKNSKYVLLLENISQNAIKQYIPNLLNSNEWYIDYTFEEIWEQEKEWHLQQIEKCSKRIKDE
jgi:hypothetical protein